jgi:hypothetical protein
VDLVWSRLPTGNNSSTSAIVILPAPAIGALKLRAVLKR